MSIRMFCTLLVSLSVQLLSAQTQPAPEHRSLQPGRAAAPRIAPLPGVHPAGVGGVNLVPFQREGWTSSLVLTTVTGTNQDEDDFETTQMLYVDWAVANLGEVDSGPFQVDLVLDGELLESFTFDEGLPFFSVGFFEDYEFGPVAAGAHTITLVADSLDQVAETEEEDNEITRPFQVVQQGPALPNLRPFRPRDWSAPLVVSTDVGTNLDAGSFNAAQYLFIDWAVLNDSSLAVRQRYSVRLLVDDVLTGEWFVDPPTIGNTFVVVQDFILNPLPAGTHTLRLVVDPLGAVEETDENDNEFVRQIEVAPAEGGQDEILFFFPSVESRSGRDTGIAIANPTDRLAVVELFLLDDSGTTIEQNNLVVRPANQLSMVLPEFFEAARAGVNASVVARSRNLGLAAFFLTFSGGARNIDGAEAAVIGGDFLVFPEILCGDGDFTEINLLGSGRVDLELRAGDGTLVETVRVQLPDGRLGRSVQRVSDLFASEVPDPAYVVARALDASVVGYETFGAAGFLGGRNAIRSTRIARQVPTALFGAQLAEVATLESVITLINPTDTEAHLTLQAFATGSATQPTATLEVRLAPGAMLQDSARQLLGVESFVGWLRVDSDVSGVVGDVSFGDPNGQYLASVQLQRTPSRRVVASHVADGLGFFTGLTFLNPSPDPTGVEVEVFNRAGTRTGRGEFTLQPFEHRPRVLSEIIPGFAAQVGGYVQITSEQGIFAFELFSLLSGGNLLSLAAVPPQRGHGVIEGTLQPAVQPTSRAAGPGRRYPASAARGIELDETAPFVPGEVIVKLVPGTVPATVWSSLAQPGTRRVDSAHGVSLLKRPAEIGRSGFALLQAKGEALAAARRDTLEWVEQLNGDPRVLYAEPNYLYQPFRVPNDEFFPLQWHYAAMKLPQAWDITQGSADIVVAVIDSGAKFDHPDLGPRLTGGQFDFIGDSLNALDGDGMDGDADDPGDDPAQLTSSYHGTHVAGTVGAVSDNGAGVAGVNWVSPLMTLRVLGAQGGTSFDIAQAVLYAAGLANASQQTPARAADVINMSLGGFSRSQTLDDAVAAAQGQGAVVVAAAGNENTDRMAFPASFDGVVSVGATDLSGGRASYSNFGPRIDVVATGGNVGTDLDADGFPDGVLSTLWRQADDQPLFQFYEGTSMASPHVAGIASLMLSVNPALSPAQVRQLLRDTAVDLGDPGEDDVFGAGLADPVAALVAAGGQPPADPLLALSVSNLDFGFTNTQFNVVVSNAGGGQLQVQEPAVETDAGGGWLSAMLSLNTLFVQVDRQGLADGAYTGRVRLSSNGGDATLEVRMDVGTAPVPDPGELFVLALDPFTLETELSTSTNAAAGFQYRLVPLPAGGYVIAAGTDNDSDGFICDEGEFCGLFPVSNEPLPVEVRGDAVTPGIDFTVREPQLPGTSRGPEIPAEGFRIGPGR